MNLKRILCQPRYLLKLYMFIFLAFFLTVIFGYAGLFCPGDVMSQPDSMKLWLKKLHVREKELSKREDILKSIEFSLKQHLPRSFTHELSKKLALPVIYLITPTHGRMEQKADLTRLSHTLLLVPNIHWVVIEDASEKTKKVKNFLKCTGLNFTHLNVQTPSDYSLKEKDPQWLKPRGVLQRNAGIQWLRSNLNPLTSDGVVYFADDDNTYDLKIFDEMRYTKTVSVWPVGIVGGLRYEAPLVKDKKVVGWHTFWKPERNFALDMAGFAVNLRLLLQNQRAKFSLDVPRGYQENHLLQHLVTMNDLEPKADNCSKILVWHTRTEKSKLKNEDRMKKMGKQPSDIQIEV